MDTDFHPWQRGRVYPEMGKRHEFRGVSKMDELHTTVMSLVLVTQGAEDRGKKQHIKGRVLVSEFVSKIDCSNSYRRLVDVETRTPSPTVNMVTYTKRTPKSTWFTQNCCYRGRGVFCPSERVSRSSSTTFWYHSKTCIGGKGREQVNSTDEVKRRPF